MQSVIRNQSQSAVSPEAALPFVRRRESTLRKLPLYVKWELFWKIVACSFYRVLFRIRSIQAYKPIDFGSALQRQEDGSLQPNERTNARIQSIDTILAKYHWADSEDARIFLEGFDAGEAWSLRTQGK
jgi:hypothetical protein